MNRRSVTVAVTGINARPDNPGPGLAVARCLKAATSLNVRVIGLAYDAFDPGLYLPMWCDAAYLLPYPSAGEEAYRNRLAALHTQVPFDVIIPSLDAELPTLIRLAPWLKEQGIATLLPSAAQIQLRAKDRLTELAEESGLEAPDTQSVFRESALHTLPESFQQHWPWVIKGLFYDAKVVHSLAEASQAFNDIAGAWGLPVLVQKFAPGEEINLTGLGDGQGRLIGAVMMKKRAVTEKGKAWAGISIHDEALLTAARRLVAFTQWQGPLEVEVMRSPQGKLTLIEVNPRFPAWIYLSAGLGCNLPEALVHAALGEPLTELPPAAPGTLFIRYAQEVIISLDDFAQVVTAGEIR